MISFHQPVLLDKVLEILDVKPGLIYLDATLGNGGDSLEILRRGGEVWGLDADPQNLRIASERITSEKLDKLFHPLNSNFTEIPKILGSIPRPVSGILFDLGLSSNQQKSPGARAFLLTI